LVTSYAEILESKGAHAMEHRPVAPRQIKRGALAFLAVALLSAGSPFVATSSASNAGGADKPVSANHGDCKNINGGVHNGYDCPAPESAI
jgi:hypothetical protein